MLRAAVARAVDPVFGDLNRGQGTEKAEKENGMGDS